MKPRTRAVHAGTAPPGAGSPVPAAAPLEQASAPLFSSLDDLEAAYEADGFVYRRYGSANQAALERALAELEGEGREVAALATASGMAAIHLACVALAEQRGRVVGTPDLYGGTNRLLRVELPKLGIDTRLVDLADRARLTSALQGAALLIVETISNPAMRVADLPVVAEAAHAAGASLMVDNTFASPILCRPLEHGADIVVHSTTKYISGHADAMGGVLVCAPELEARFRELTKTVGASPGPLDSWLALRGLRTLALRVEAASAGALALAAWLQGHPRVSRVNYPGLESHPDHAVAARLLDGGYGGMLSFEVEGGEAGAGSVCRRLRLIPIMPSLAHVATTISYPLATSHRGLPQAELDAAGVTPGLLRLSVGIEDVDDLRDDLEQALSS